jgi:hypothetical protein
MTMHLSEPDKIICPLLSGPGKSISCKKEHCAWYVKYTSVVETEEAGCAIMRIALNLIINSSTSSK